MVDPLKSYSEVKFRVYFSTPHLTEVLNSIREKTFLLLKQGGCNWPSSKSCASRSVSDHPTAIAPVRPAIAAEKKGRDHQVLERAHSWGDLFQTEVSLRNGGGEGGGEVSREDGGGDFFGEDGV